MPDVSGASAVNTRVHTKTTKRTRGCGCIGHPAFPAPSDFLMAQSFRKARTHRAARMRRCVSNMRLFENSRHSLPSSYPAHAGYPVRRGLSILPRCLWNTGSPAGACHPAGRRPDRVAGDDSRVDGPHLPLYHRRIPTSARCLPRRPPCIGSGRARWSRDRERYRSAPPARMQSFG